MNIPPIAHELEYNRLDLSGDETEAIDRWVRTFIYARESGLLERCQQLLAGIRNTELSPRSQGLVLRCRALLEQIQEKHDEAIHNFQRSLGLLTEADDPLMAGRVCNDLGTIFQSQGKPIPATEKYRQAIEYWLPTWGGSAEEAMARNNLGISLADSGLLDESIQELNHAAKLYRKLGMPQGEARTRINLGRYYRRAGKMEQAKDIYLAALDILKLFDDQHPMVDVFNGLAIVYRYLGDFETAADYYTQSLELAQQIDDLGGQTQALNNLGNIYQVQEKYEQARYFHEQALQLYELLGDRSGQAKALGNLGHILHAADEDYESSLDYYRKGLTLYQEIQDAEGEAYALINIAGVHRYLKEFDQAEPLFHQALVLGRELQNVRIQDFCLCALGTIRLNQGRWDESEEFLQEALGLQEERQDQYAQVETLYKLGMVAYSRGEYETVLAIIEPAWEIAFDREYARWLFKIAWLMGDTFYAQQNIGTYNYYALALAFAKQYDDKKRYEEGINDLTDQIRTIAANGNLEVASEICQLIIDQLQKEEFVAWTQTTIDYFVVLGATVGDR